MIGIVKRGFDFMHPILKKRIETDWIFRWLFKVAARMGLYLGCAYLLYVLSLGPVIWVCKWKPVAGWTALPTLVQVIYSHAEWWTSREPLASVMIPYYEWWISRE